MKRPEHEKNKGTRTGEEEKKREQNATVNRVID